MAKNFKSIYDRTGDSIALEQSFFAVKEVTKGVFAAPVNTSFFYTMAGGGITHEQPITASPHRSGRHNTDTYAEKKVTEWEIPTFVNIDVSQVGGDTAVEPGIQLLWESMLGRKTVNAGVSVVFDAVNPPDITFSLYENGDKWSQQARGSFVQSVAVAAPGDGQAGLTWSGRSADRLRVGVGKFTTSSNTTNIVTLAVADEAKRFPVGAQVMIIEGDGTTRSADTPNGSYRTVTARNLGTGAITLSGAVLADADGTTGGGFYLAYAEPTTPTGISNIQTGLVGSITIDGLGGGACVRNFNLTLNNNHEVVDYCYGHDGLDSPYFIPGSRLSVELEVEMNLNDNSIEWLDELDRFIANDIEFILGDAATRHLKIDLPKIIFNVPSTSVPEEGSIPFTANGIGYQTTLNAGDEVIVTYL